jgi:hypothetical protein
MRTSVKILLVAAVVLVIGLLAALALQAMASVPRDLPPAWGAPKAEPVGDGQFRVFPQSAPVEVGVPYRMQLYTHCGLDWPLAVDFDRSYWDPIGPGLASDGSANPPISYGNPFDHGTMTLKTRTLAQYRSDGGATMMFSRHPGPRVAYLCM